MLKINETLTRDPQKVWQTLKKFDYPKTGRLIMSLIKFRLFDKRPHNNHDLTCHSQQIDECNVDTKVKKRNMYGRKYRPQQCRDNEIVMSRIKPY